MKEKTRHEMAQQLSRRESDSPFAGAAAFGEEAADREIQVECA